MNNVFNFNRYVCKQRLSQYEQFIFRELRVLNSLKVIAIGFEVKNLKRGSPLSFFLL